VIDGNDSNVMSCTCLVRVRPAASGCRLRPTIALFLFLLAGSGADGCNKEGDINDSRF
jgi:hypothetical protein